MLAGFERGHILRSHAVYEILAVHCLLPLSLANEVAPAPWSVYALHAQLLKISYIVILLYLYQTLR